MKTADRMISWVPTAWVGGNGLINIGDEMRIIHLNVLVRHSSRLKAATDANAAIFRMTRDEYRWRPGDSQ